jgi:hypothetical protein
MTKGNITISDPRGVGERPDGTTQYKYSGWLRGGDNWVVCYLDVPKGSAADEIVAAMHPTAIFAFAETTALAVPAELKGKLLSAASAVALESAKPTRRKRR